MLRGACALAALIVVTLASGPAAGGDDEPEAGGRFIKDKSSSTIDVILEKPASDQPSRPAVNQSNRSDGPPNLMPNQMLRGLCYATMTQEVALAGQTDPLCVQLKAADRTAGIVDAGQLAQRARDQLRLPEPELHTSPEAPVKALVGLETWMWVPPTQWTVLNESASLGGTNVSVRAEPISTRWDMGEATKFCPSPGRVWRKGLGQDATTPCGYTYKHTSLREPEDKYQITGQIRYAVTWTCSGPCSAASGNLGTIDSATTTAALEVSERHSVVIR